MGYSKNIKTLEKMLPFLGNLAAGRGDQWSVPAGMDPSKMAYKIREALYVADVHKEKYPALAQAHHTFKVEIVDKHTIQAVFRPAELHLEDGADTPSTPTHGLDTAEKSPTNLAGPQTAASIIQAWHNAQPSNTPIRAPAAAMDRDEILRLYQWASKRTPVWLVLATVEGAITLTPYTRDLDGLGWDPSDD